MFPPTWDKTVTVYHKTVNATEKKTTWAKTVYGGCFWGSKTVTTVTGLDVRRDPVTVVRIPYNGRSISLSAGDVVFKGKMSFEISDVSGKRASDYLSMYAPDCFTVKTVSDNTQTPFLRHYRAEA